MKNQLFICLFLILTACHKDEPQGMRKQDLIIGKNAFPVAASGDTLNVKTRYGFNITSIKAEIDRTVSPVLRFSYGTLDSVFYRMEKKDDFVEIKLARKDTLQYEGLKIYQQKQGLLLIVEKNPLSVPRKYTLLLDDFTSYGYVYITQQEGSPF